MDKMSRKYILEKMSKRFEELCKVSEKIEMDSIELIEEFPYEVFVEQSEAESALLEYGVFEAIREISKFEMENFGEVHTDYTDSLQIANSLYFLLSSNILYKAMKDSLGKDYLNSKEELIKLIEILKVLE